MILIISPCAGFVISESESDYLSVNSMLKYVAGFLTRAHARRKSDTFDRAIGDVPPGSWG